MARLDDSLAVDTRRRLDRGVGGFSQTKSCAAHPESTPFGVSKGQSRLTTSRPGPNQHDGSQLGDDESRGQCQWTAVDSGRRSEARSRPPNEADMSKGPESIYSSPRSK